MRTLLVVAACVTLVSVYECRAELREKQEEKRLKALRTVCGGLTSVAGKLVGDEVATYIPTTQNNTADAVVKLVAKSMIGSAFRFSGPKVVSRALKDTRYEKMQQLAHTAISGIFLVTGLVQHAMKKTRGKATLDSTLAPHLGKHA